MIFKEFVPKNIVQYIFGVLALIGASFVSVTIPKLLGEITDALETGSGTVGEIKTTALIMLGFAFSLILLKFTYRAVLFGKSRDLECFLRAKLFDHFQSLPPSFYNKNKTGDLMAYVINDLNAIRMAFAMGFVFLVEGVLINSFSIVAMAGTIDPLLTLLAVGPIILAVVIIIVLRPKIRRKFTLVQNAFADLSDKIQENISGIRVVKGYVQEDAEVSKMDAASRNRFKMQMDYIKISALLNPATQISFGIGFALLLTVGGVFTASGRISLGDFVAMNTYLTMLIMPIMHIGRIVEIWQRAMASAGRLDEVLAAKSEITDAFGCAEEPIERGEIEIKNLTFKYPGTDVDVLKDISVNIPSGKTLGIIGKTGSGKTTLANLIMRLYKIEDGKIFADGVDINHRATAMIRQNIGYVPQDNFLFAADIETNIKFFDDRIKHETVIDSSKLACVYDNIMDFPDQFKTVIGERGITLSGGQKQRISIARAVAKNPAVLILDDSLSAVDTNTEEKILTNIKQILENKTGIIISHRVSTMKNADEIIYLDGGRIIERGTHESLLEQKGEYYNLSRKQAIEKDILGEDEKQ